VSGAYMPQDGTDDDRNLFKKKGLQGFRSSLGVTKPDESGTLSITTQRETKTSANSI
jgi:hypothetical protein